MGARPRAPREPTAIRSRSPTVTTSVSPPPIAGPARPRTPPHPPGRHRVDDRPHPDRRDFRSRPKAQPLKLLVLGDSLAGDFGQTLYEEAEKTGVIKPAGPVDYHISTGLTRPDMFDWPGELQSEIAKYHPSTIVIALGLNDGQQTDDAPRRHVPRHRHRRVAQGVPPPRRRDDGHRPGKRCARRLRRAAPDLELEREPLPLQHQRADREGSTGARRSRTQRRCSPTRGLPTT